MRISLPAVAAAAIAFASPTFAACPAADTAGTGDDWLKCIEPLVAQALTDIETLSADDMQGRKPDTPGSDKARAYIIGRLTAIGVGPLFASYEQPFTYEHKDERKNGTNVVGVVPGTAGDNRMIVLTAHYDHLGIEDGEIYNGADDNASGVAALLAIGTLLEEAAPLHTTVIALVDAEEAKSDGAKALANAADFAVAEVGLNINLDMISHGTDDELFAMGGAYNSSVRALIGRLPVVRPITLVMAHDRAGDDDYADWSRESDQVAFSRHGVPWLYFANEDHDDYHEPTDDFPTIQPTFYRASLATALAAFRIADHDLGAIGPADSAPDED